MSTATPGQAMAKERWQPPAMKTSTAEKHASAKAAIPKVTVDENVVRKMLKVNPTLRQGRTTSQVKKSLERGDSLMGATVPAASTAKAQRGAPLPAGAAELRDTMTFFVHGKLECLSAKEAEVEERRKALDAELESARASVRQQVTAFLGLLDQETLAKHGPTALAEHAKSLAKLGLDTTTLVDQARRGGKS
jgi:hypothetical protein